MDAFNSWKVNERSFTNKLSALQYASTINSASVSYHFCDAVWDRAATLPANLNLAELYKERAQQLRDKYKFLILNYSAGADSHNIFETFVRNKIKLDAIQVKWPSNATMYHSPSRNPSSFNLLSEWEFTILPSIKEIASKFPDIKILLEDWGVVTEVNMSQLAQVNHLMSLGDLLRFSTVSNYEKNYNTGIIWGIDKPLIYKNNGQYGFFFRDMITSVGQSLYNENVEYFYWAADMPELAVSQARALVSIMQANSIYNDLAFTEDSPTPVRKIETLRQLSIKTLYPYRRDVFQVSKYQLENKQDWDSWLYNSREFNYLTSQWQTQLNNLLNDIDSKFCRLDREGNKLSVKPINTKIFWLEHI
jgi:hypothetical protein